MKLERHDRLPTRKSEAVLRRHPLKSPPLKHRCNKVATVRNRIFRAAQL
jgi:hypothetical protein